jgi:hypothetical protein
VKPILNTENPLVLRVDFTSQAIWEEICRIIQEPVDDFYAYVEFRNDPKYEGVTQEDLRMLIPNNYNHNFIIMVDRIAISEIDHPLLIVDLSPSPKGSFRAIPSTVQSIENNLSIGNMSFEEFARTVDENGVFRGFFKG